MDPAASPPVALEPGPPDPYWLWCDESERDGCDPLLRSNQHSYHLRDCPGAHWSVAKIAQVV
jgi:hypothetical protein